MSNLFLFNPKQQKSSAPSGNLFGMEKNSSPFFGTKSSASSGLQKEYIGEEEDEAQYEFGDEEDNLEPLNNGEEFLDDKNDETFGDIGDINDEFDFSAAAKPLDSTFEKQPQNQLNLQQNTNISTSKLHFFGEENLIHEEEEEEEEYPDFDEKDDEEEIVFQVPDESPTKAPDLSPLGRSSSAFYGQNSQKSPIDRLNTLQNDALEAQEISADDLEAQILSSLQLQEATSTTAQPERKANGIKVLQKQTVQSDKTPTRNNIAQHDKQQTPSTPSGTQQKTSGPHTPKVINQNVAFNTYLSNPFSGYPIFKKVLKAGNLMTGDEIDFILRQQLSDLQVENPFVDDFYFCEHVQKQQSKFAPNFPTWVQQSVVQSEENSKKEATATDGAAEAEKPRIFGRLPSQNVRGMRTIVMLDTDELKNILESNEHQSTVNKNEVIQVSIMIEKGYLLLSQIKDLLISGSGEITLPILKELLPMKLQDLCDSVLNIFQITLSNQASIYESKEVLRISQKPKGTKFICKCLSILPDTFAIPLLENMLFNWTLLTQTLYGMYNYRRQMMVYMQIPEEELEGIIVNPDILFGQLRYAIVERSKRLVNPEHRAHFENLVSSL